MPDFRIRGFAAADGWRLRGWETPFELRGGDSEVATEGENLTNVTLGVVL